MDKITDANHITTGCAESALWHLKMDLLSFKVKDSRLYPYLSGRHQQLQFILIPFLLIFLKELPKKQLQQFCRH